MSLCPSGFKIWILNFLFHCVFLFLRIFGAIFGWIFVLHFWARFEPNLLGVFVASILVIIFVVIPLQIPHGFGRILSFRQERAVLVWRSVFARFVMVSWSFRKFLVGSVRSTSHESLALVSPGFMEVWWSRLDSKFRIFLFLPLSLSVLWLQESTGVRARVA